MSRFTYPVGLVDFEVQIEILPGQVKTYVTPCLVVDAGIEIPKCAVVITDICTDPVHARMKQPFMGRGKVDTRRRCWAVVG